MRFATLFLLATLSLGLTGCWFGKKKAAATPPAAPVRKPVPPVKTEPAKPAVPKPDPNIPEPPKIETPPPSQVMLPGAPEPTPPRRRRAQKKSAPVPLGTPQMQPAPPPVTPAPPQLGEILTPELRREYEAGYAHSLARARAALMQAEGRTLDAAQRESVDRIRTFISQAEEAKPRDLATALQLVHRADVLGEDLIRGMQQ